MNKNHPIEKRRTFAIISHPDAGKTTVTEKLLLLSGAIQLAGTVKGRKASRFATSDWMELEKQRGISITSSVMQFCYNDCVINLLDTPGHADFSEDTYRTLTAVDSALMVIDVAKGIEERTKQLMKVCRLRNTPIITFINKLDRYGREPIDLLDEIEAVLKIKCMPITWPIGMGAHFLGVYHLLQRRVFCYQKSKESLNTSINYSDLKQIVGVEFDKLDEEIDLMRQAGFEFSLTEFLNGQATPLFFGSAVNNFGIKILLDAICQYAPPPSPRHALTIVSKEKESINVLPKDQKFSAFVFKIQANMDPKHRDRIAFARICSGCFHQGMQIYHVRTKKMVIIKKALIFMADGRAQTDKAWPGDIIGIHNHGTIQIGDTFSCGKPLHFSGIPHFAPLLFRLVFLKNPLKFKALRKGLLQLSEEGAVQFFSSIKRNDLIVGAIGTLQFETVAYRLHHEYTVDCRYKKVNIVAIRWVEGEFEALEKFKEVASDALGIDSYGALVYFARSQVNLQLTMERWPMIKFRETKEYLFTLGEK